MRKTLSFIWIFAAAMMACSTVQAQIITYDFNALGATTTVNAADLGTSPMFATTFEDPNASGSNITVGSGLNSLTFVSNTTADYFQIAEGNGLADGIGNDLADAFATGEFIEFTATADPGFVLNLADLSFDFARAANGANDYGIQSSVDGFASTVFFGDDTANPGNVATIAAGSTTALQTVDLSGAEFQGLSTVTFRVAVDDRQTNTGGASATVFDDISLGGTVAPAVPEPSSLALLGLGVMGLVARRRRYNLG